MKNFLIISAMLLCLIGCDALDAPEAQVYDQCIRAQLFQACLERLPSGPSSMVENGDWGEVVEACEDASRRQSLRPISQVKPECRSSN